MSTEIKSQSASCSAPLTGEPQALVWQVHPRDNVLVALQNLEAGQQLPEPWQHIRLPEAVQAGHKLALTALAQGDKVIKYGYAIGVLTADVAAGSHIHSHNLKTALAGELEYSYQGLQASPLSYPADLPTHFKGYRRGNGQVGTRNELWILNTVGCVNQAASRIAKAAQQYCEAQQLPNIDGVFAYTHPFGCSQLGDDLNHTRSILAGLAQNPNAGAVLIIGLGCENNQLTTLLMGLEHLDQNRLRAFNAQQVSDEDEEGLAAAKELLQLMSQDARTDCPVSDLSLGMKCGGSDGFSGLTANPLVGQIADLASAAGARVILTETPEMFGAEQVLMARARTEQVFDGIVQLVNDFKQYFIANNQPVYENPSPGNKAGGLTTLEEKSLGAIQKGGSAIVEQVIDYGQQAKVPGLTLLQGPGNDAVSSTALTAAGATLILFTTGRGTPLGFPVPTVKIASNSALAARKPTWIDYDAGSMLQPGQSVTEFAKEFFRYLVAVASGERTRNEVYLNKEIAIWKNGVTL
ncbi:altronate dehydratase family protein [Rheinheimera sp.]|uniref:UxaA family hydrolase n=1 Tax=Rheinheimera sp. TaxID=1869214 RepID=UPI00307FC264